MSDALPRFSSARTSALVPFSRTERVIAFCRVLLAVGTLALVVVDPTLPSYRRDLAYPLLIAYVGVSGLIFALVRRERVRHQVMAPLSTGIDIVWIWIMTLFTERVASPFFLLNVFVISSVSMRWGLAATAPITLLLALMYPAIIHLGRLLDPGEFAFHRAQFLRPIYLVPIGYLLGYLGEHERRSKLKMAFLLSLMPPGATYTPGRTIARVMRRAVRHFDADRGVLVLHDPDNGRYFAWELKRQDGRSTISLRISERDPFPLPFLSTADGLIVNRAGGPAPTALSYDMTTGVGSRHPVPADGQLPCPTEGAAVVMAPVVVQHDELRGRAFLIRDRGRKFSRDDLEFLLLIVGQVAVTLESRRLQVKAEEVAVLEERARIARDLHDGFIQSLAGIDLRVEACKTWLQRDPARLPPALDDLHLAVDRGYKEVRHFLNVLRTTSRGTVDLGAALGRVAAEFISREGLAIEVECPDETPSLPAAGSYELTQIVREALQNAVRHGCATEATVRLAVHPNHVSLFVSDNGRGFDGDATVDGDGFVVPARQPWSIRERTAALGGTLQVRSTREHGAEIALTIPTTPPASTFDSRRHP